MNIASLVENKKNPRIPDIAPGDTVKVSARIVEGGKERIQVFQGVVIQVRKGGAGANFTVRHVAFGIGVERTFPFASPLVEKVEIVRHGKVRRAKLYYLRGLSSRQARRKIKRVEKKVEAIGAELLEPEPEEALEPEEFLGEKGEMVVAEAEPEAVAEPAAKEEAEAESAEEVEKPATEEAVAEEPEATGEPEAEAEEETKVEEPVAQEATAEVGEVKAEEPVAEEVAEEPKAEPEAEPAVEEVVEEPESEEEKS
jgi:large subunit ribosomal protein L19